MGPFLERGSVLGRILERGIKIGPFLERGINFRECFLELGANLESRAVLTHPKNTQVPRPGFDLGG